MIPKTIHYCWFGQNPKPELAEKCIRSWKRYCKGYEIIEWNEDNFDISSAPLYVRQAYDAKKWAFVSDYVRLWAMYNFGGIYMDTDVEVIKPLNCFLNYEAVSGFEAEAKIPTGLMACRKGFPLFGELLHQYDNITFIKEDGSFDLTTNVKRITDTCMKFGFVPNNQKQTFAGFTLFPTEYFCPKNLATGELHKTKNTYTIHHFAVSWFSDEDRQALYNWFKKARKDRRRHLPNRILMRILGDERYSRLKTMLLKHY